VGHNVSRGPPGSGAQRERERVERVWPAKKKMDFEYRKLFSIQHRTENNSKEIGRSL
jgi:hypothetical protein